MQKNRDHSNHNDRVVEKVCLKTGQVLASFRSITEAAQSGGLFPAICAVVKGTKTSHMGFGWRDAAAKAPASIPAAAAAATAVQVPVPAMPLSTVGGPVASTLQQDDSMTKQRSPKRIKVTVLDGETNDYFAVNLPAELPNGDLVSRPSILFPAKNTLPPPSDVTTDYYGSDWMEQGGSTTEYKIAKEGSVEQEKETVLAVVEEESSNNATDSQNSNVYKPTFKNVCPSSAAFSTGVSTGFTSTQHGQSSNKENTITTSRFADARGFASKSPPISAQDSDSEFETKQNDDYLVEEPTMGVCWETRFEELLTYKKDHEGSCRVPTYHDQLGDWVVRQRTLHRLGKLDKEKIEKLESIGFEWKLRAQADEEAFNTMLKRVEDFVKRNGNCRFSQVWKEDPVLGHWIKNRRSEKKRGTLKKEREERLNAVGFVWQVGTTSCRKRKFVKEVEVELDRQDDGDSLDDDSLPFDKEESIAEKDDGLRDCPVQSKIEQVCQTTGNIRRFDSMDEAVKITGFSRAFIRHSFFNVTDGFLWRVAKSDKSPKRSSMEMKKNPIGRKRKPIEKLCLKTGQVLEKFESSSEAAQSMGVSKSAISDASRRGSTSHGFGWRYTGSTSGPSASTPKKKPIEKLCLTTGQVLEKFESGIEASQSMGVSKSAISDASLRESTSHEFGWRYANPTASVPASTPGSASSVPGRSSDTSGKKAVERYCLQTGKVVQKFESVTEAARSVGVSAARMSIAATRYDGIKSCPGFGWRFAQSRKEAPKDESSDADSVVAVEGESIDVHPSTSPPPASGNCSPGGRRGTKIEQVCLQTGKLLQRFDSISDAAKVTGFAYFHKSIFYKRMGQVSNGFFWRVEGSTALPSHLEEPNAANVLLGTTTSSDDHSPDDSPDEDSISERPERENECDLSSGDESSDDDSVFAVEGESNDARPSTSQPSASGNASRCGRKGTKIEQVCLQTGKLLQRFDSISDAAKLTGLAYFQIYKYMGQVSNGFFWRVEGSTALPPHLEEPNAANVLLGTTTSSDDHSRDDSSDEDSISERPERENECDLSSGDESSDDDSVFAVEGESNEARPSTSQPSASGNASRGGRKGTSCRRPVEKICLKTGQVLGEFGSIAEATVSVGASKSGISNVLSSSYRQGSILSCAGFGWRYVNSRTVSKRTTQTFPHTAHLVETSTHFTSRPSAPTTPRVRASAGKPVEKYCIKTGRLMARFGSIVEAALSVGVASANIMAVVSSPLETSKICMGFGWRYAASVEPPPPEASDHGPVPAVSATTVVGPSHVAGVLASVGTYYSPQQGDRFRIYFDKVKDAFGERHEAAGWYTGTATDTIPLYDKQHLVYLRFDDLSEDMFLFPAPDIQRILPSAVVVAGEKQQAPSNNKVFAVNGTGALDLAYECSPDHIEVGDVIFCKYQDPDQAEGQWHRGRVAVVHENGTCDVVFDGCDHDCNLPKSRFRLMERGRDVKGWLVGLTINSSMVPQQEESSGGKIAAPARVCRIEDDRLVILTFPHGTLEEISRPYEQVAAAVMADSLEKAKAWTHDEEDAN